MHLREREREREREQWCKNSIECVLLNLKNTDIFYDYNKASGCAKSLTFAMSFTSFADEHKNKIQLKLIRMSSGLQAPGHTAKV